MDDGQLIAPLLDGRYYGDPGHQTLRRDATFGRSTKMPADVTLQVHRGRILREMAARFAFEINSRSPQLMTFAAVSH
jgi:hypothetical protein